MNPKQKASATIGISSPDAARIAGFSYLMVFIFGIFGNFFVFEKLIVPGDTAATANNIIANESLFRLGIASWIIVIIFDTLVAWALFLLLKPISKSYSLLAAWFRLLFVAIFAYSFVDYFSVIHLFNNANYLRVLGIDQLQVQAMLLLNTHNFAVQISYVFFGLHISFLGYLILKSRYIPRIIGILLLVASCGYLINSFGNFLSPAFANNKANFIVFIAIPAMIAEFSFTFWLLFRGKALKKEEIGWPRIPNK